MIITINNNAISSSNRTQIAMRPQIAMLSSIKMRMLKNLQKAAGANIALFIAENNNFGTQSTALANARMSELTTGGGVLFIQLS
jgi:hypothetical protein